MVRSKSLQHDQFNLGQLMQKTNKSDNKQTNNATVDNVYGLHSPLQVYTYIGFHA